MTGARRALAPEFGEQLGDLPLLGGQLVAQPETPAAARFAGGTQLRRAWTPQGGTAKGVEDVTRGPQWFPGVDDPSLTTQPPAVGEQGSAILRCCYRRGSAAAARSRATDPAAARAEPAAILGLRRCTDQAARTT